MITRIHVSKWGSENRPPKIFFSYFLFIYVFIYFINLSTFIPFFFPSFLYFIFSGLRRLRLLLKYCSWTVLVRNSSWMCTANCFIKWKINKNWKNKNKFLLQSFLWSVKFISIAFIFALNIGYIGVGWFIVKKNISLHDVLPCSWPRPWNGNVSRFCRSIFDQNWNASMTIRLPLHFGQVFMVPRGGNPPKF